MTIATRTVDKVTRRPKTKPCITADGVTTGMHTTLARSIALTDAGEVIDLPAGTLITSPLSSGHDGRLPSRPGANASRSKIGTAGAGITYRI